MSHTTITGNMTADPELRWSQSGNAWVTFTVAQNRGGKDGKEEKATFVRCKAFKELAENIAESLTKGTRVNVTGRLETEEWESNGEKRSALVLIVDTCGPDLRWATARVTRNQRKDAAPAHQGWSQSPEPATDEPPF